MATSKMVQGDIEPGKDVEIEAPGKRVQRLLIEEGKKVEELKELRKELKMALRAFRSNFNV